MDIEIKLLCLYYNNLWNLDPNPFCFGTKNREKLSKSVGNYQRI